MTCIRRRGLVPCLVTFFRILGLLKPEQASHGGVAKGGLLNTQDQSAFRGWLFGSVRRLRESFPVLQKASYPSPGVKEGASRGRARGTRAAGAMFKDTDPARSSSRCLPAKSLPRLSMLSSRLLTPRPRARKTRSKCVSGSRPLFDCLAAIWPSCPRHLHIFQGSLHGLEEPLGQFGGQSCGEAPDSRFLGLSRRLISTVRVSPSVTSPTF